jgi:hypothetical protein
MLNKYLASKKVYKERLAICASCDDFFKPTGTCTKCGCFMRVKAKISSLSCPKKLWLKTSNLDKPDIVPQALIDEVELIWPDIKDKKAKDHKVKARLIELHNTIYLTNFNTNTNCSSCLASVFKGLEAIYKTYIEK